MFNDNTDIAAKSDLGIKEIANAICRGGWPMAVKMKKQALKVAYNYVDSVINIDVKREAGFEKNPETIRVLLQSLARNISTLATSKTIMDDISANNSSMTDKTLNNYLNNVSSM